MSDKKKQLWQTVKFTLFSISAGVIQIGAFALLEIFIKDEGVSNQNETVEPVGI